MTAAALRERHGQLVASCQIGDCFRASMSLLLDVPNGDYLPTTDSEKHSTWWEWGELLRPLGLALMTSNDKGPIWKRGRWIASVPSKNCPEPGTHAIVMRGQRVEFDPSRKKRYRPGINLLGTDLVLAGTWIEVADASLLHYFLEWQESMQ